jgi:hypothetical protein
MRISIKNIYQNALKKAVLLLGCQLLILACTEKIDWELQYQEEKLIVVDGKITNEMKQHEVKLTRPVFKINGEPVPVSGAVVEINNGQMIHQLTEDPLRPGVYLTSPDFAGEVNRGYQLRIGYGGKRITAIAFMREVTPFQFMRVVQVETDPPLYEAYISNSDDGPAIVRMELDWSHVPGYDTLSDDENHALIYHYTLNSVDVNRIFSPDREHVRFPPGTIVYREKESVSREYGEYLRGILSETDWRGGVFDVLPGNARTNLSEGAVGFFVAAEVIRDTLLI